MDDLIGRSMGSFHIESVLGKGGMATVYLAQQQPAGRTVALKVLPRHFTHDQTFIARFNREVRMIAQLEHHAILPVFDFGEHEQVPYIAMAYMPGGTLAERVPPQGMPLQDVVRYVKRIAEALDYMHARSIVHRDLKPSNILMDEDDNPFIADFGIARADQATVQLTGEEAIGTPTYMAPELYSGGDIGPQVDVYELGVMVYEMLAGRTPFLGNPAQLMHDHRFEPLPDIQKFRPDLPDGLQYVLNRAMAKRAERRFPTASAFAEALATLLVDPTWLPAPDDPDYQADVLEMPQPSMPVRRRRRPWLPWAIGAAVIVLLIVAGVFLLPGLLNQLAIQEPEEAAAGDVDEEPAEAPADDEAEAEDEPPAAGDDAPPVEGDAEEAAVGDVTFVGGGTGFVGYNASDQGFTVDLDCVITGREGCNGTPLPLNNDGTTTPSFGEWSPDGTQLAYTSGTGEGRRVVMLDADGTEQIVTDVESFDPAWSPDGTQIAFAAVTEDFAGAPSNIWTLDIACLNEGVDTCYTARQQVTDTNLNESAPQWLEDGTVIAFLQEQASTFLSGFTIDLVSGAIEQITPTGTDVVQIKPLPDGSGFLFIDILRGAAAAADALFYDVELKVTDAEGATSTVAVLSSGEFGSDCAEGLCVGGGSFDVTPDGETALISYAADAQQDTELYALDLACLTDPATCADSFIPLTDNGVDDKLPSFATDGTVATFIRDRSTSFSEAIDSDSRSLSSDIFLLDLAAALAGGGEEAITEITTVGVVDALSPQWQPAVEE